MSSGYYVNETIQGISFCATTMSLSVGSTETNVALLVNPAGSGKLIILTHLNFSCNQSVLTAGKVLCKVYQNPITINSNGTLLNSSNMRVGGDAPIGKAYKLPTITGRGLNKCTRILNMVNGQMGASQIIVVPEGSSLLITEESSVDGTQCCVDFNWMEATIQ